MLRVLKANATPDRINSIKINLGGTFCALPGRVERAPQLSGALAAHVIEKSNYFFIGGVMCCFLGEAFDSGSCFQWVSGVFSSVKEGF
jgi:hypothetical protein